MVTRTADIKCSKVIGCLAGGCEHCRNTALQFTDFCRNRIICRVCQSCIKISILLKIKETSHLFAGGIFKGCALVNREHPWFSILRSPSALDTDRLRFSILLHILILLMSFICEFCNLLVVYHILQADTRYLSIPLKTSIESAPSFMYN